MIRNTQKSSKRKMEVNACIDIGSSFFRLLVIKGGVAGKAAPSVVEERVYVGWGEDLVQFKEITQESAEAARQSLRRLVAAAKGQGCDEPVITATNTLRSAGNAAKIKSMLENDLSLPIIVLSEEGEAALGFLGASTALRTDAHLKQLADRPVVLIDVGGTSTELAWGEDGTLNGWLSMPWGTHSVLDLDQRGGPATRSMRIKLMQGLAAASLLPGELRGYTILATGGTAVSCAVVQRYMRRDTPVFSELEEVTLSGLDLICHRVEKLIASGRARALPLEKERIRLLLPGVVVLSECAVRLGASRFFATSRDLRWGAIAAGNNINKNYVLD
jgi:exopolyphosphatase/guanosine-5'-triphosphate,3'-diphosphate pyrophosphatase